MSDRDQDPVSICVSCRFGSGLQRNCTLIQGNQLAQLIEEGPCDLTGRLQDTVGRVFARRFPSQSGRREDVAQESLLKLLELGEAFPGDRLVRLRDLDRWLERFARNAVIDHLRKARVITRLRCGACVHFSLRPPNRCTLEFTGEESEGLRPNPWWGPRVQRQTDPKRVDPPCLEFEWKSPASFDIFEHEGLNTVVEGDRAAEVARSVILALDELASRGDRGLREASTIRRHYFR
ncbi:MAG: hypothetical protein KDB18_14225, partial [Salinibacterium sp.]|nr:hypothetical protein [Salinibacterium sp.]